MAEHVRPSGEHRKLGQGYEICVALWDGPRTVPEVLDHIRSYFRWLGLHIAADTGRPGQEERTLVHIRLGLNDLVRRGRVTKQGQRYALTPPDQGAAPRPAPPARRARVARAQHCEGGAEWSCGLRSGWVG